MLIFKRLINIWDSFFFSERPTYNLAIFRIVWGLLIFVNLLFDWGNVADFYGPDAILSLDTVKSHLPHFHFSLFYILPNTIYTAWGIYLFTLFSLGMVTIGFLTRIFLFSSLIGLISLHMRNIWIISSADILIRCVFFILIWSPCYHVLSFDSVIAKKRGKPFKISESQWTWRLIQIQIAVLYLWTSWVKIKGGDWLEGSAVYYATRLETMRNLTIPWILDNIVFLKFNTWMALVIEISLGTLIWFKKMRTPVIILGILLHLGIELSMAIPFFEWMMIVLLMNFYTPEEFERFYMKLFFQKSSSFKIKMK